MKYVLIDTANLFFRARHVAFRAADEWEKVGYALHITLSAVNKVVNKFGADHVVFALEGRSWRKDVYAPYKRNRSDARAAQTEKEQAEDKVWNEAEYGAYDDGDADWECTEVYEQFATDESRNLGVTA